MYSNMNMENNWDNAGEHLKGLYNLWEQDQLCDVTVKVGGRKFRAHKAVLAATGSYFLAMFTSGFRESSAGEISIEGNASAFEVLLHFVYTGEVSEERVASCMHDTLEMACYMQFTEFASMCSEAIEELVTNAMDEVSDIDVCKLILLAQRYDYLHMLYDATLIYFEDKVESLKCLDIFLENTSVTFLKALLCRENLSNGEENVLELVINWLKHDWENRKIHSHQLLQKVRLGLISTEDIKELISPEILSMPACSELVNHILDVQESKKPKELLAMENPDVFATRSTIMAPIMCSNGNLAYYVTEHKIWANLKNFDPLPSIIHRDHTLVVANGILYIAGGSNGRQFCRYQADENKWLTLPPKPLLKSTLKLVHLGSYIYAIGTCFKPKDPVIERYDIEAKKWEVLKKVHQGSSPNPCRFSIVADDVMDSPDSYCCCERVHPEQYISAVVFEGKIFISSTKPYLQKPNSFYRLLETLMVLDPETNSCQVTGKITIDDRYEDEWEEEIPIAYEPALFIYKDQLYRVMTVRDEFVYVCVVNLTQDEDGRLAVELGEEVNQDNLPQDASAYSDNACAFCIQEDVFVSQRGIVCVYGNQVLEPGNLHSFPPYACRCLTSRCVCSNPVWFLFEKKN